MIGSGRRLRLPLASWPLADQGVISLGTFLFNILLARNVALSDYGLFAMFLGILSLLQAGCASVLFYPLSVRGAMTDELRRRRLIATTLILTALVCLPLSLILGIVVGRLVDGALLLPAIAVLLFGQIQEAARRGLLCEFRHLAAIPGDALSYLGQTAVLLLIVERGVELDLSLALTVMAATSLAAALVQIGQLSLKGARPLPLLPLLGDFWLLGRWSLTSNLLGIARLQSLPWLLAASAGPAAAGAFQIALNIFNVTSPIVTGVCNIIPQAAARALSGGMREAFRAAWPYILAGAPMIAGFSLLMLLAPAEIVSLVYGPAGDTDAIAAIRILAVAALLGYAGATGCAFLHGVEGGRDALVADIAATFAMLLAAVPSTLAFGIEGGCAALTLAFALRAAIIVVAVLRRTGPARIATGPRALADAGGKLP